MADIAKRLERADKLLQKGKHEAALAEYLAAVEEVPHHDAARQKAADLCVSLNRTTDAASLLGPLFERQASVGDIPKAIITYKKLARLATPKVEHTFRFAALIERSSRKEALEAYEIAFAGFLAAGRKKEALTALERVVALDPSVETFRRYGQLCGELGDTRPAAAAYFKAGELERAAGGDGLEFYARAFETDGENLQAALAYGRGLLKRGQPQAAIGAIEHAATGPQSSTELRDLYGQALLAAGRPLHAEPYLWEQFQRDPSQAPQLMEIIAGLIDGEDYERALTLARKIEEHECKAGRRRDYVAAIKDVTDQHPPGLDFLEYLVELYNTSSREYDYCATLLRLFALYFAAGNFIKAGNALDRAAEVDPYEPGHEQRLEMLRGKIDQNFHDAIAHRFHIVVKEAEPNQPEPGQADSQPSILEDFMLQAEIFLQYSMRSKALERLARISKLFPHEEEGNEKLRLLFEAAAFEPEYPEGSRPRPAPAAPVAAPPAAAQDSADNLARVSEITRSIYRQSNVKGVLFTTVNEVGRHWGASRCVAALCTPGKPPSAALEYCSPQVKPSEITAIVKLIATTQSLTASRSVLHLPRAQAASELEPIHQLLAGLGVRSLLAIPLLDGEEQIGILILAQCGAEREWQNADIIVLRTIADQVVQAFHSARLRRLVKTMAVTEEKSGLFKRSSYLDVVTSEVRRGLQQHLPTTLLLLNFGKAGALVKECGEPAVNEAMLSIGQALASHLRQSDIAVRYDLTTIALILSDTNEQKAFLVVEKARRILANTCLPGSEQPVPITAGIAEAAAESSYDPLDIVTELINRADRALELAKADGGNKAQALPPRTSAVAVA